MKNIHYCTCAFFLLAACGGDNALTLNVVIERQGSLASEPKVLACEGPKDCGSSTWKNTEEIVITPTAKPGYVLKSFTLQTQAGETVINDVETLKVDVEPARKAGLSKITAVFKPMAADGVAVSSTTRPNEPSMMQPPAPSKVEDERWFPIAGQGRRDSPFPSNLRSSLCPTSLPTLNSTCEPGRWTYECFYWSSLSPKTTTIVQGYQCKETYVSPLTGKAQEDVRWISLPDTTQRPQEVWSLVSLSDKNCPDTMPIESTSCEDLIVNVGNIKCRYISSISERSRDITCERNKPDRQAPSTVLSVWQSE